MILYLHDFKLVKAKRLKYSITYLLMILSILSASINRLTDRRDLLLSVWGDDSFSNSRNLDVYIRKLRGLLKEDKAIEIQTIKGKGYLFIISGQHVSPV